MNYSYNVNYQIKIQEINLQFRRNIHLPRIPQNLIKLKFTSLITHRIETKFSLKYSYVI